jgi:hypothetical protein
MRWGTNRRFSEAPFLDVDIFGDGVENFQKS